VRLDGLGTEGKGNASTPLADPGGGKIEHRRESGFCTTLVEVAINASKPGMRVSVKAEDGNLLSGFVSLKRAKGQE